MMMMDRAGRMAVLLGSVAMALPLTGASDPSHLNPMVRVLPNAIASVPSECEEGLAPSAAPRITAGEVEAAVQPASSAEAPPSGTLRSRLRATYDAATANDRERFRSSLAATRGMLESYPGGAERTAAGEVVHVFDDIDRLWSWQFDSPTGAFYDETSSGILAAVSGYPGFDAAIGKKTLTSGGRRLYPSIETRAFLLQEASRRLGKVGISTPATKTAEAPRRTRRTRATAAPVADEPTHALPAVHPRHPPAATSVPTASLDTPSGPKPHHPSTRHQPPATSSSSTTPAAAKPVAAKPASTTKPVSTTNPASTTKVAEAKVPAAKGATSTPAPVPPPAPAPAPVAVATATVPPSAATTTAAPAVDTSATTTETAAATDTVSTAVTETTASAAATEPVKATSARGLLLPIVIIIAAAGMLIVLMKTK
jgi:hypothetical protein